MRFWLFISFAIQKRFFHVLNLIHFFGVYHAYANNRILTLFRIHNSRTHTFTHSHTKVISLWSSVKFCCIDVRQRGRVWIIFTAFIIWLILLRWVLYTLYPFSYPFFMEIVMSSVHPKKQIEEELNSLFTFALKKCNIVPEIYLY